MGSCLIPPDNAEIFETPLLTCWMEEDGLLYSISKKTEKTVDNYKMLFSLYEKLSANGTRKICILGDISDTLPMRKEVYGYVSAEIPKYVKAMALFSRTAVGRTVGTAFELLNVSDCAICVFDNREEAVNWLKQYIGS